MSYQHIIDQLFCEIIVHNYSEADLLILQAWGDYLATNTTADKEV